MSDDLVKRLQDDAEAYRASLSDFEDKNGVHKTELGYQWADKPHRHVSDLCKRIDAAAAHITALEAENKRLRDALEPFAKKFTKLRTEYSKRYVEAETVGLANFDKMPDEWPMEKATFNMGTFRRAAAALEKK